MDSTPKWFLPLAILAFIWNVIGCLAFAFDMMLTEDDIAQLSAAEQQLYASRPAWAIVGTAMAVILGSLGCLGMILKKRWSFPMLVISLIGLLLQDVHLFVLSDAIAIYGNTVYIMQGLVFIIAVLLVLWSNASIKKGLLS